jgi:single-strand DNA-binding protein|nr:MAG TPA: Single strand binding protein [Caudoviricetes sp.]
MEYRIIIGRLTHEPTMSTTQGYNGELKEIANFSIAVNRPFKNANGEYEADFFNCSAFGKTAETIGKYCGKGKQVCLIGRTQNEKFVNKEGIEIKRDKFIVDKLELLGSANDNQQQNNFTQQQMPNNMVEEINEDDLPF